MSSNNSLKGKDVSNQDDGGWEEYGKKSRNKSKTNNAPKQWGSQQSNPKAWANPPATAKPGARMGRGSGQSQSQSQTVSSAGRGGGYNAKPQQYGHPNAVHVAGPPPQVIPPPLKTGWGGGGWSTGAASNLFPGGGHKEKDDDRVSSKVDEVEEESDTTDDDDDDDDELMSDDYDSDESHNTKKKNRWFMELFQCLDGLTVEQINEPDRQWHCPACHGGPGAIEWYRGLQPLIAHAKTKKSKRVKLHRNLALLLDEELRRRGTSAVPAGEIFGMWKGLEERADKEIVWPPMVVIMNTRHDKDENEKWIGMGNQELLDCFKDYAAVKARHSYGPQGHRGMSILIFEPSAVGYAEAERLSKRFEDNSVGRTAWERTKVPFYSGGKRQLFGFLAEKQDMENFNQHSLGKSKLKFEMRSYHEMVVSQMKQMSEDNQQLLYYKNKVAKEQMNKKALQESFGVITEKLRKTMVENQVVKLRTKKHHDQNKEEMDSQEQFFSEQIQQFYDARNAKEENFEKIQQHEREKLTQSEVNVSADERLQRAVFIKLQDKVMAEFVEKRDRLMKAHEERMLELKRRHFDEKMALEKEFDEEFNKLMEEYTPTGIDQN